MLPLGSALVLGLIGGLHCAGMCGPLLLAMPAAGPTRTQRVAGRLVYHLGRISVYAALGAVFGLLGQTLLLAGIQRWVSLAFGALLLLGIALSPQQLQPAWIVRAVGHLKSLMIRFLQQRSLPSLAILGALNGLLPCGLIYAAAAASASAASPLDGAAYMLVFGVGTVPVTLGISLSGHLLPSPLRLRLRNLAPVSVGLVGVLLVLRGLALDIPFLSPNLSESKPDCCRVSSRPLPTPTDTAGSGPRSAPFSTTRTRP